MTLFTSFPSDQAVEWSVSARCAVADGGSCVSAFSSGIAIMQAVASCQAAWLAGGRQIEGGRGEEGAGQVRSWMHGQGRVRPLSSCCQSSLASSVS